MLAEVVVIRRLDWGWRGTSKWFPISAWLISCGSVHEKSQFLFISAFPQGCFPQTGWLPSSRTNNSRKAGASVSL
jgi:hypothetical protein